MNPEAQLEYEVLSYVVHWERDTDGPGGTAPFIYPDVLNSIPSLGMSGNSQAEASYRRLETKVVEMQRAGLLKPTAHAVSGDMMNQVLTDSGYRKYESISRELTQSTRLARTINWVGAISRPLVALLAFLAGTVFSFFLSNVSPSLYCHYLPNSGVGFLTPCERPDEGKAK